MATSRAARGWLLLAAQSDAPIPADWALDADGRPTTNARLAVEGTLRPLGEHKGYGLALALGLLTDALTGNAPEAERPDWLATDREFLLSMLCIAIDPAQCLGPEYAAIVSAALGRVKASRVAERFDEIRIPGERSARHAADANARGIVLGPAM